MYCQKCGNELSDDDNFCGKCGAKVIGDLPPPTLLVTYNTPDADTRSPSTAKKWLKHPVIRAILYLVGLLLITILLYAMFPQPKISVAQFVTSPHGLTGLVGRCIGATVVSLPFFIPLLIKLSNLEILPKGFIVELICFLMLVHEFGSFLYGQSFSSEIMIPVLIGVLVFGIIVTIIIPSKKKK